LYDGQTSIEAAEVLEERANELEATMPFKADVTTAKDWFFVKEKLPPMRVTEKREEPALDEEQVREWIAEDVPWAKEYGQVSKMRRAVSMWYRGYPELIGQDGRLRCSFRQGHVKTGRMSVERVQLQAMPKEDKEIEGLAGVRTLLQAQEGYGLWNLDLSQAELRIATYYSGCKRMWKLLAEGADLHGVTCEQVLGISRDDPEWKTKRDIAKRLTFGSIFQIGGKKFQATLSKLADIHLPLEECGRLVSNWRRMYPEFGVAYRKADNMAQRLGYVNLLVGTPYAQRSYFGERDWPNTAWNRIVQASLAQAFKLWMIEVESKWPGYLILTVHDSVVLEAPLDEGDGLSEEIAAAGAKLMTSLFMGEGEDVQMIVDVERYV
jgi:DNA polymerase I-like protein with 3'-5' exonuclease and polymerase domains